MKHAVKRMKEKQVRRALDEALNHLHWLTRGGEFAYEMENSKRNIFCYASWKEYNEAKQWLEDFYKGKE